MPLLLPLLLRNANRSHSLVIVWVNANVLAGCVDVCAADKVLAAQGPFSGGQLQPGSRTNAERQISAGVPGGRSAAAPPPQPPPLIWRWAIAKPSRIPRGTGWRRWGVHTAPERCVRVGESGVWVGGSLPQAKFGALRSLTDGPVFT
jgi:hypothetical protein